MYPEESGGEGRIARVAKETKRDSRVDFSWDTQERGERARRKFENSRKHCRCEPTRGSARAHTDARILIEEKDLFGEQEREEEGGERESSVRRKPRDSARRGSRLITEFQEDRAVSGNVLQRLQHLVRGLSRLCVARLLPPPATTSRTRPVLAGRRKQRFAKVPGETGRVSGLEGGRELKNRAT